MSSTSNKTTEEILNSECAAYVKEALEKKVVHGNPPSYNECLDDMTGEEVIPECIKSDPSKGFDMVDGPVDNGANADLDEELEELDLQARKAVWHFRRANEFHYKPPNDKYSKVTEHHIDVSDTKKRLVFAVSDLHIGGNWSDGMDSKLRTYFNKIYAIAKEEVAAVVLVGDILEMWLEKYHELPPSNEERVKQWKQSTHCQVLIDAVATLTDEYNVKVFYVRGNHDQELADNGEDIKALFNGRAIYVPNALILRMKISKNEEVRARFSHGHEWDVFNSYMLPNKMKICGKPIGYFVSRAVATAATPEQGTSDLEDLLINVAQGLMNAVPHFLEDNLIDVLSVPRFQRSLMERLFEGAFKVDDLTHLLDAKCKVSKDCFIKVKTLLEYPLFGLHSSVVGSKDVFHMLKAATGDYEVFIERSDEDVVVLGHTHSWDLKRFKNNRGNNVLYANTGCWTQKADEFSAVVLDPPTVEKAGGVFIDYGKND